MPRKLLSTKMADLLKLTRIEFVYGRLNRANVDPETRTRIVRAWQAQKAQDKEARKHQRDVAEPWNELLNLFRAECVRATTAVHHCPPGNTQKALAYTAYLDCLRRHRDRIKLLALTSSGRTPSDYARLKKLPNNGATWPDWIDPTERANITAQFNSIPHIPGSRPFRIFVQLSHAPRILSRINKLKNSLARAIHECDCKIEMYPAHADFHRVEMKGLLAAQDKLNEFILNPACLGNDLPATHWHLIPKEYRDQLVVINRPTDRRRAPPEKTNDEKLFD